MPTGSMRGRVSPERTLGGGAPSEFGPGYARVGSWGGLAALLNGAMGQSRHLSERIDRPVAAVYAYAADPANLPHWAPGLGTSVERVDGDWFVDTPAGRARIAFAPPNDYGVLDHEVTLPSGEVFHNPMRVIPDGDGSEIVFSLRRLPGVSDDDFDRDAGLVAADLARLRDIMQAAPTR